jgi:hypothetical protein
MQVGLAQRNPTSVGYPRNLKPRTLNVFETSIFPIPLLRIEGTIKKAGYPYKCGDARMDREPEAGTSASGRQGLPQELRRRSRLVP